MLFRSIGSSIHLPPLITPKPILQQATLTSTDYLRMLILPFSKPISKPKPLAQYLSRRLFLLTTLHTSHLQLPGYTFIHRNHIGKTDGGIGLYVHSQYQITVLDPIFEKKNQNISLLSYVIRATFC